MVKAQLFLTVKVRATAPEARAREVARLNKFFMMQNNEYFTGGPESRDVVLLYKPQRYQRFIRDSSLSGRQSRSNFLRDTRSESSCRM